MEWLILCLVAFLASILTFFSGFGLGTLLLPAFALFFSVELAIAATAIVHLLNNVFKTGLMGKHIQWPLALWFGGFGVLGAILGAYLLGYLGQSALLKEGEWLGLAYVVTPVGLTVGVLLIFFAVFDFFPELLTFHPSKSLLALGGMVSGFFGGLSGHQGALRSSFLIKLHLGKEVFIATGIIIAVFIDIGRIGYYFGAEAIAIPGDSYGLLTAATLSAFAGAWLGRKYLKKITFTSLQRILGTLLVIMGLAIAIGFI